LIAGSGKSAGTPRPAARRLAMKIVRKLFACEAGTAAIEYGLVAMLIAVAAIAGFQTLSDSVVLTYDNVSETMDEGR
jgi:pilus assembly protein Flp/PilA